MHVFKNIIYLILLFSTLAFSNEDCEKETDLLSGELLKKVNDANSNRFKIINKKYNGWTKIFDNLTKINLVYSDHFGVTKISFIESCLKNKGHLRQISDYSGYPRVPNSCVLSFSKGIENSKEYNLIKQACNDKNFQLIIKKDVVDYTNSFSAPVSIDCVEISQNRKIYWDIKRLID